MKKALLILCITSNLFADGVFSAGNKNIGFKLSTEKSFNSNYTVVGADVNYFLIDNLSIGASYDAFLGGTPDISQVTVPVTYHIPLEGISYRPYIGAFYNQTFIDKPYNDYNIYGGRVGVSLQTSLNSFFSLGWVQEFSNSNDNIKKKGYPEVKAGFSF